MDDRFDYKGHNLVFIVGCPRSGTTWLQKLLACHPKVRTGHESNLFLSYIGPQLKAWRQHMDPNYSGQGIFGLACYFSEEDFKDLIREYTIKLLQPMVGNLRRGEIFVEKTPSHSLFLTEIAELLPESRIIHIVRDCRDVVASLLHASKSWGHAWAPGNARKAAKMWVRRVEAVHNDRRVVKKENFSEVRYESLFFNTSETLRSLCRFLDLSWDEQDLLRSIEENRPMEAKVGRGKKIPLGGEAAKVSGPFRKEPEYFVHRGQPGGWTEELNFGQKFSVWLKARGMMNKVGYHWPVPW